MAVKLYRLKRLMGHWLTCFADNRIVDCGPHDNKRMHLAAVAIVNVQCLHDAPKTNP